MRSREEIEDILSAEIAAARERQLEAGMRFRQMVGEIPSMIPAPDGSLRIQQAGAEYRSALDNLRIALLRFNDFLERGVVPDDVGGWRVR